MSRFLETLLALGGLIVLLPVFAGLAIAVKAHDGGPVFYRARRVGKGGAEFSLLKFRSMSTESEGSGSGLTQKEDPRVTRVGRFMRKYKLDEFPQLVNVLLGHMGFVGPRPEDPRFVKNYSEDQRQILRFRPGITSPASLAYRNEEELLGGDNHEEYYLTHILPRKLSMDLEYMNRRTTVSDLRIVLHTVTGMGR